MVTRLEAMKLEWNTSPGGEISYEGHSVNALQSRRCRTTEEHKTCFEGTECVDDGFRARGITFEKVGWSVGTSLSLGR